MSLEQYKDASRKELWEILQIQAEEFKKLEHTCKSRSKTICEYSQLISDLQKTNCELESALRWSRDSNTGFEPSVSVMHRYYDDLIPKVNK